MIKAVLFDLWNTLAYLEGLEESRERLRALMGEKRYERYRQVLIKAHREPIAAETFMKLVAEAEDDLSLSEEERRLMGFRYGGFGFHLYPETMEILAWAKERYAVALVSNCIVTTGEQMDDFGIRSFFDSIVLSYEVGLMKPEKEIFEVAFRALGVSPKEAIMIGDKEIQDMQGAKNAGMRGILIDRGGSSKYPDTITNLLALKDIL